MRSHSDRRIESKDDDRHSHSHVLSVEQSTLTSHSLTIKSTMSVRAEINIKSSCSNNRYSRRLEVRMYSKMSNTTSEVVLTRCIVESPDSTVYEATLDGKLVVAKFAFTKNRRDLLKREGGLYVNKLHKLQGTVIPIFYGFYYGRLKESVGWLETRRVNCIVLEHCGEHIPGIGCLSFKQRYDTTLLMTTLSDT